MHIATQRKSSMHDHDFKLLIERYSAGEVNNDEAGRVKAHLRACGQCAEYLETLRVDKNKFLELHPYPAFLKAGPLQKPWYIRTMEALRRPALYPAYGCLALLLALAPVLYYKNLNSETSQEITYKGTDGISFLLKRNNFVTNCTAADTLFPGDELQVLYSTRKAGFVSCVSIGSHGEISWYQADQGGRYCGYPTKPGMRQPYPSGIVPDNSQGKELVILLVSDHNLASEAVKKWIMSAIKNPEPDLGNIQRELESNKDAIGALYYSGLFAKGSR
jgi:hypothetical protein